MSLSLLLKHLRWSALQCPFQFVVSPLFAGLHPPLADCFNRWLPLYIYLEFMNIYETSTVSYSSWFINPKAPFIGPGLNRFFLNAPSSNQLRSLGIQWLPGASFHAAPTTAAPWHRHRSQKRRRNGRHRSQRRKRWWLKGHGSVAIFKIGDVDLFIVPRNLMITLL